MKNAIAPLIFAISLSSCTNSAENNDVSENGSCIAYLHDTGYDTNITDKEIEYFIKENKISIDKSKFCFGKKKTEEGFCYLALPRENSTDGDYTDCPIL